MISWLRSLSFGRTASDATPTSATTASSPLAETTELSQPTERVRATPKKLDALTSVRFIAAAMIVLHHTIGKFGIPESLREVLAWSQGVSFFFVLSGFILTYVYPTLPKEGRRRFLVARFARIWPAHIVGIILVFVLFPNTLNFLTTAWGMQVAIANLAMVHAWIPIREVFFSLNAPSWSISTEFFFYICFPFLIIDFRRTWLPKLALTLLLAYVMIRLANAGVIGDAGRAIVYINPLTRLFEFTLGMSTALAFHHYSGKVNLTPVAGTVVEVAVLGVVLFLMHYTPGWARAAGTLSWVGPGGTVWLLYAGFSCLGFAALILVLALQQGYLARLLSFPLFVLLGEISYSVYLVHYRFSIYFDNQTRGLPNVPGWVLYSIFWGITLLLAYLIWAVIERPARQWLIDRLAGPSARAKARANQPTARTTPASSRVSVLVPTRMRSLSALVLLVALAGLSVSIVQGSSRVNKVSETEAQDIVTRSQPEARNIIYDQKFTLLGADVQRVDTGLRLELAWQSMADQPLEYTVMVQTLDAKGKVVGQVNQPQDPKKSKVAAQAMWQNVVNIPADKVKDAAFVSVSVFKPGKPNVFLFPESGRRNKAKHGLLLNVPAEGG